MLTRKKKFKNKKKTNPKSLHAKKIIKFEIFNLVLDL